MNALLTTFRRSTLHVSCLIAITAAAGNATAATPFNPALQPFGQLPRLGLTGFNLSTGTQKAFQSAFDPNGWNGDLVAYPISALGRTELTTRLWRASAVFESKQACYGSSVAGTTTYYSTDRKIGTLNGASKVAFRWANLSGTQQTAIGSATAGPKILDFVRGDRSNEKYAAVLAGDGTVQTECGVKLPATGIFRARENIMGDIIHGQPVFVGAPPADYIFDSYQSFKSTNASRAGRVYVGGNDGMVHAFDATTGDEIWAYVPSFLIPKLKDLTVDPYIHSYFVDAASTVGDVNFGTTASPDWRTVMVGGVGAGGKGLYALDVTVPTAADDAGAAAKILWEITPATTGFSALGDTYAEPVIVRLNTGQWAAVVGNGYNNGDTGTAVLYIIDIKTGALIKALNTGSGSVGSPNGLSSPVALDSNFDGLSDQVYAGDIDGNLWKFDISSTSTSSWSVPTTPLFAAGAPILGRPDIAAHPLNGYLVYFSTGRLFTTLDAANATVQNYAYSIWDGAPATNTALLNQTLTEAVYGINRVRVSSGLPINWDNNLRTLHRGWRTAFAPGESAISGGFVRDARYHILATNPTTVNTPPPKGENWLMELDYLTGGVGDKLIFDLSGDSLLTDADRVGAGTGPTTIPVGVFEAKGLLSPPVLGVLSAKLSTTLFNDNPFYGSGDVPAIPTPPSLDVGVSGGHFDVDLYYGPTFDYHTHEYDDKYDVTGVNFLNASDPGKNVSNAYGTNAFTATTPFKILIANQRLSPAVKFSFGGNPYVPVYDLVTSVGLTMATQPTFTVATVSTLKYNMPKNAFEAKDWGTGEIRSGLVPTQTRCVKGQAPGVLGPNGEYRNGALVFQLVRADTPDSAVQLAKGTDQRFGYRLNDASRTTYLLAEWSTFWHHPNGFCMGTPGWTQTPPLDTSPSRANRVTPAAGSQDPPRDELGTVTNTTVTLVNDTSGSNPGGKIRTTVTTYSTGVIVTIVEKLDSRGKIISVTVTTYVPPGGSPGGGGFMPQANNPANTLTGFQQSRNSGKLGRVSWREVFGR